MKTAEHLFKNIVEIVYNLLLEFKEDLKNLLDRNIADTSTMKC